MEKTVPSREYRTLLLALGLILAGSGLLGAGKNKPNPESAAVVQEAQRAGVRTAGNLLFLETEDLTWAVGIDGRNHSFVDRRTGKNYLAAPEPFMQVLVEGQWFGSTSAALERGFLYVEFGDSGVWAKIHVRALPRYLTLELTAVNDHQIISFQLAHLPLTLTRQVSSSLSSCRDEEYAAAVIPLNLETTSSPSRGPHTLLVGQADQEVRLEGAAIAVLGCPTPDLLDIIEQVEIENGLPHPTLGGVWARRSPEQMKSYLFVDLSEAIADSMIEYARTGAFGYIVVYDGTWNFSHGTYPVNTKNFPTGEDGLKAVSDKIHAAGLKFGMHNLDMVVEKTDSLVHPVPAAGFMMYPDRQRFLAADIGPDQTFIPTTTSPAGLLSKEDKSGFHGRDLRLGDEIILDSPKDLRQHRALGGRGPLRGVSPLGPGGCGPLVRARLLCPPRLPGLEIHRDEPLGPGGGLRLRLSLQQLLGDTRHRFLHHQPGLCLPHRPGTRHRSPGPLQPAGGPAPDPAAHPQPRSADQRRRHHLPHHPATGWVTRIRGRRPGTGLRRRWLYPGRGNARGEHARAPAEDQPDLLLLRPGPEPGGNHRGHPHHPGQTPPLNLQL